jgi:Family of unknown function (DUF5947)
MTNNAIDGAGNAIRTLRRLATTERQIEQCDFCNAALEAGHRHLLEVGTGKIVCACDPCALRFENVIGRWKLIPRDAIRLTEFQLSEADWEAFALPINLVFLFHSTRAGKTVAMYPSPGGATESLLPIATWDELEKANPALQRMEPDVQALLVNRLGEAREYYIAPIDRCFELAGIIRAHWKGFSGGAKVEEEMDAFFNRLRSSAKEPDEVANEAGARHA